jgi:hypothetical protein
MFFNVTGILRGIFLNDAFGQLNAPVNKLGKYRNTGLSPFRRGAIRRECRIRIHDFKNFKQMGDQCGSGSWLKFYMKNIPPLKVDYRSKNIPAKVQKPF